VEIFSFSTYLFLYPNCFLRIVLMRSSQRVRLSKRVKRLIVFFLVAFFFFLVYLILIRPRLEAFGP